MTRFSFINNVKLNKKMPVIKHFVLLFAILMVLIIAVFAWFSLSKNSATADGLQISIETGGSMLISLDGGESFQSSIDILSVEAQDHIDSPNVKLRDDEGKLLLKMDDITSDGKTFYRPEFDDQDAERIPDVSKTWTEASKNRSYISQKIIFRTEEPCNIYMGSNTKITTSCPTEYLASNDADLIVNKTIGHNFSNDCIVGALRISAVDSNGNICFVCIPRSDVQIVKNADDTLTMNTGNSVTNDAKVHYYYSPDYKNEGTSVTNTEKPAILGFDGTQKIASTTETTDENGKTVYEGTATVNLWLEGCDAETTRILSGGKFKVNFEFIAQ